MPAHEDDYGFSGALVCIKQGQAVSRRGWNGAGQYVQLHTPNGDSEMTLPFIYIRTVQGDRVPWLASQTDLLALDWYEVETATKTGSQ